MVMDNWWSWKQIRAEGETGLALWQERGVCFDKGIFLLAKELDIK